MAPRLASLLAFFVIFCVIGSVTVAAQGGYGISSPDSSPVPERSFDFQGSTHTIDSQISAAPGGEITVDVSAPNEVYRVYLYNSDEQIVDRQRGEGDGSFTFDLSGYEPGSYAITTHSRETDQHEAILPVLVEGYDVTVDGPSSVTADESFDVSISVTESAASGPPATVSAVFASDGETHTVEASDDDGAYTASIAADTLDSGDYTVYGIVQGTDQAFDRNELLGFTEAGSLTVTEAEGTEGNGTDGGAAPQNETATADETASPTATETTTDDSAAITPGDSGTATPTTEAEGPGFSAGHLAIALGAVLGIGILRRRIRTET